MINLEQRNQKIIDAIIKKASIICPESLALIGVYGSFATGDFYDKSDLDLLILINDDNGWQLGTCFIQDDLQVGHDIYCTKWDALEYDSEFLHPNISKLMDSKIVYCADDKYKEKLENLRQKVKNILETPFSAEDYEKAEKTLKESEHFYTMAMVSDDILKVYEYAGDVIYYVENAIAMLNKQYFRYGVKRAYEELNGMSHRPENLCELIENVIVATSVSEIKEYLTKLMKETMISFQQVKDTLVIQKKDVSENIISGTYEEMYSNWRNKMYLAAERKNCHLAFMNLVSLNSMLNDIHSEVDIDKYDALSCYNPKDLNKTANAYDDILKNYLVEYNKVGIAEKRYIDIDSFVHNYLKNNLK